MKIVIEIIGQTNKLKDMVNICEAIRKSLFNTDAKDSEIVFKYSYTAKPLKTREA